MSLDGQLLDEDLGKFSEMLDVTGLANASDLEQCSE